MEEDNRAKVKIESRGRRQNETNYSSATVIYNVRVFWGTMGF